MAVHSRLCKPAGTRPVMSSSKSNKADTARTAILGVVSLIVAAILGIGIYTVFFADAAVDGNFAEGTHYRTLETPLRQRSGAPIPVWEFFSYGCVHCKNFDPLIEAWKPSLADDVAFERKPAAFSPVWELLGRAYYTLDEMGTLDAQHSRLFRAIHDEGRQFLSAQMLADFCTSSDADAERFMTLFNSESVQRRMRRAQSQMREAGVNSVPTLVVAGKYIIDSRISRAQSLKVVEYLIDKERTDRGAATSGSSSSE